MTPKELRNERLAERLIKNLQRRHIEGFYCPTSEEAVKKVSELIADGSSVTWGGHHIRTEAGALLLHHLRHQRRGRHRTDLHR